MVKNLFSLLRKAISNPWMVVNRFYPTLWCNWFNPLYTLVFNLHFLPFRQAIHFPIWVYGWPRIYTIGGHIVCKERCYPGMVRLNKTSHGSPQAALASTELNLGGG